jgi:hypothetical protein
LTSRECDPQSDSGATPELLLAMGSPRFVGRRTIGRQLRFVFRNFSLNESHLEAESAAETAEFAGAQGKFWRMHDALYENQD